MFCSQTYILCRVLKLAFVCRVLKLTSVCRVLKLTFVCRALKLTSVVLDPTALWEPSFLHLVFSQHLG
jgi:hypothetical protein